jgi:rare lipoprotein A
MNRIYLLLLFVFPGIICSGGSAGITVTSIKGTKSAVSKRLKHKNIMWGTASYYHDKFNGRKTASGEIFWNDSLSAANNTLPLGTWVRVTNLKNDSVVVLKINDRLASWSKRTIDLSVAAAKKLNFIRAGITKVKIEILKSKPLKGKDY